MTDFYDQDRKPMAMLDWANAMTKTTERVIGRDTINGVLVSTVWIGLNHSFGSGPPLIFETMIFDGPHDQWQARYATKEDAQRGHERVVAQLKQGLPPDDEGDTT